MRISVIRPGAKLQQAVILAATIAAAAPGSTVDQTATHAAADCPSVPCPNHDPCPWFVEYPPAAPKDNTTPIDLPVVPQIPT